jgi:hypothetical protein
MKPRLIDKASIADLASSSDTAVSLNGSRAATPRVLRRSVRGSRQRGEVLHMTAGLQSAAPSYPLIQLFRSHRTLISASVGMATFAALVTGPGRGLRSYLVAGAAGSAAGMASAVAGELIDVVADTLLPQ